MLQKIIGPAEAIIKVFVFFVFFSYLMMFAFYSLGELDYLFHIKAGEYVAVNKTVPDKDIFSFTMSGKDWVDHEWLYQVLIYGLHQLGGVEALFFLKVFIFSLAFFILAIFLLKIDWLLAYPLLFYGLQIALRRFTLRPDNLSFIFFIFFLMPFVFKKRNLLYLLPFIQIIWANVHGFFFIGPLVLVLYLLLGNKEKTQDDIDFRSTLKKVTLFTVIACFLQPHPVQGFIYPLSILKSIVSGASGIFYDNIQELRSPLLAYKGRHFFMTYLGIGALSLCFWRRRNLFYVGLYIVFALFALNSLRNVYFFVPVVVAIFADRYAVIKEFFVENIIKGKGVFLVRVSLLVFSLFLSFSLVGHIKQRPGNITAYLVESNKIDIESDFFSQDSGSFPKKLMTFIRENELPSRMFNNFNIGAPLIFNFFPDRQVFIDGRTEVYGEKFFADYLKVVEGDKKILDDFIADYDLKGFILGYAREAPTLLIRNIYKKGFVCVYFSHEGIVFVDKDFFQANDSLWANEVDFSVLYGGDIDMIQAVKDSNVKVQGHFNVGYVLYLLGYTEQSKSYFEGVLKVTPNHSLSYFYLADIYYRQGYYDTAFLYCRNSLFFVGSSARVDKLMAKIHYKIGNIDDARGIVQRHGVDFDEFVKEVESE